MVKAVSVGLTWVALTFTGDVVELVFLGEPILMWKSGLLPKLHFRSWFKGTNLNPAATIKGKSAPMEGEG